MPARVKHLILAGACGAALAQLPDPVPVTEQGQQPLQPPQPIQPGQPQQPQQPAFGGFGPPTGGANPWNQYANQANQYAHQYTGQQGTQQAQGMQWQQFGQEMQMKREAQAMKKAKEKAKEQEAEDDNQSANRQPPSMPLVLSENSEDYAAKMEEAMRTVSSSAEKEEEAHQRTAELVNDLKAADVSAIESKAAGWTTIQELEEQVTPHDANAWADVLVKRIELLEDFNKKDRKTLLDFDAKQAVEIVYKLKQASFELQNVADQQKKNMKAALKKASHAAMQMVKGQELAAKRAAREWKTAGKETVRAQKNARMSEDVYERHSDVMSDAAGDAGDRAENYAERLIDTVRDHFIDMEDKINTDTMLAEKNRQLQQRTKVALHAFRKVVANLGAEATYQEAKSSAAFQQEEKNYEATRSGQSPPPKEAAKPAYFFATVKSVHQKFSSLATFTTFAVAGVVGGVSAVAAALRRSPMTQLDIEAPPLLG
eukprot:TRINITY_DN25483_c0_g1_i1.p1 TRINITY_DN25483_c0_g1~~TRINITY_DN25483_c0_g1_i1.p1  ORF type:complete len:485 (+),score=153.63 TRINITY_DN25483_c0_g1_i1:76-1530(+)